MSTTLLAVQAAISSRPRKLLGWRAPAEVSDGKLRCSTKQALQEPVEPRQHSSHDLERALRAARITASMGSVGDCYDKGLADSFCATLETELFVHEHGGRFTTHHQARLAFYDWIGAFATSDGPWSAGPRKRLAAVP